MQKTEDICEAAIEGRTDLGALGGSDETAAYLYEMAPGEAMWELVRFPARPVGAHKVSNRGDIRCRALFYRRNGDKA